MPRSRNTPPVQEELPMIRGGFSDYLAAGYKEVLSPSNSQLWTMAEYREESRKGRNLRLFSPTNVGKSESRNFVVIER